MDRRPKQSLAGRELAHTMNRPEARPARWADLMTDQRIALERLARMMVSAVSAASSSSPEASTFRGTYKLDHGRSTNLGFISGQRGTGKSTIMLSLMSMTERPSYFLEQSGGNIPEDLQRSVNELKHRVVWLEPIDLEPAPRNLNLLSATLRRVIDIIPSAGTGATIDELEAGFDPLALRYSKDGSENPSRTECLQLLRDLQRDFAQGWRPSTDALAKQSDLEEIAHDELQIQSARLGINERFNQALNAVAHTFFSDREKVDPIFVLPIDDFDLNPTLSLEILRLLRMLSAQRLFCLVLGDMRTLSTVSTLSRTAEIAEVVAATNSRLIPQALAEQASSLASKVSAHAIRKLIPPAQRVYLEPLRVAEAADFRPMRPALDQGPHDSQPSVIDLLHQWRVFTTGGPYASGTEAEAAELIGTRIESVADFFDAPAIRRLDFSATAYDEYLSGQAQTVRPTPDPQAQVDPQGIGYVGADILRTTSRRLMDLYQRLVDLQRRMESEEIPVDLARRFGEEQGRAAFAHQLFTRYLAGHTRGLVYEEFARAADLEPDLDRGLDREGSGRWDFESIPLTASLTGTSLAYASEPRNHISRQDRSSGHPDRLADEDSIEEQLFEVLVAPDEDTPAAESEDEPDPTSTFDYYDAEVQTTAQRIKRLRDLRKAVEFRSGGTWSTHYRGEDPVRPASGALPRDATGSLALLFDMVSFGSTSPARSRRSRPDPVPGNLHLAGTEWFAGPERRAMLEWPRPPLETFWGWDIFRADWDFACSNLSAAGAPLDHWAVEWMRFGTAAVVGCHPSPIVDAENAVEDKLPLPRELTPILLQVVSALIDGEDPRAQVARWALEIARLLMPEFGLSSAIRGAVFPPCEHQLPEIRGGKVVWSKGDTHVQAALDHWNEACPNYRARLSQSAAKWAAERLELEQRRVRARRNGNVQVESLGEADGARAAITPNRAFALWLLCTTSLRKYWMQHGQFVRRYRSRSIEPLIENDLVEAAFDFLANPSSELIVAEWLNFDATDLLLGKLADGILLDEEQVVHIMDVWTEIRRAVASSEH